MGWLRRLRATANVANVDRTLADETQFHLEALIDEYVARGLAPQDAETQARRRLGNLALLQENTRDADTVRWVADFARDVRYACRLLRKNPGFTVAAILTFALGVGANAAIFSLFTAVVLRPLPVREPERLVLFTDMANEGTQTGNPPKGQWPLFSLAAYDFLRQQPLPFESLAAVRSGEAAVSVTLPDNGAAQRAQAHLVSGTYFATMGVRTAFGRALERSDDRVGAAPVAVVSDGFWRRALGADPEAVGRVIRLNATTFTVVGVAPPAFFGERVRRSPDLWVPLVFQAEIEMRPSFLDRTDVYWLSLIGRLAPGATREGAQGAATIALRRFATGSASPLNEDQRSQATDARIRLFDGRTGVSNLRDNYDRMLRILLGVVGVVLLLTCANVASLLLSRAVSRSGELSLRLALGAGRLRLVRQFVAESLLLAAAGALVGVMAARWAADGLLGAVAGASSPARVVLDMRLLLLTTTITLVASLLFGLVPILATRREDVAVGGRPARHGWVGRFSVKALVVGQLAMSLMLLVGSMMMARSLLNLQRQALGFDPENVVIIRAFPRLAGHTLEDVGPLYQRLFERLNALPGVRQATLASYSPFGGTRRTGSGAVEGYVPPEGEPAQLEQLLVGPAYPATLGIPLLQGRAIGAQDTSGRLKVGMVNEAFVRRYFSDGHAVGRHFGVEGSTGSSGPTDIEIVGVLADAQFHNSRESIAPIVFTPLWQDTSQASLDVEIAVRRDGNGVLPNDLKRAISDVDGSLPLSDPRTLTGQVSTTLNSDRLAGRLVAGFGALALLLACVGLYGVMSQAVAERIPELGIRLALGASPLHVVWIFVRYTLLIVATGLAIGVPLSAVVGRVLASQLYGVSGTDAWSFMLAALVLVLVALLTGAIPARRASRIDPLTAIRAE